MHTLPTIKITGRNRAAKIKRRFGAVLTIQDVHQRQPVRFHGNPHPPHLRLAFEDYDGDLAHIPSAKPEHALAILQFGREHIAKPMLIHCNAGVARSTAAALGILVDHFGVQNIDLAWHQLLEARSFACPNRILLDQFDSALGTGGLIRASADKRFANDPEWQQRSKEMNEMVEDDFPP